MPSLESSEHWHFCAYLKQKASLVFCACVARVNTWSPQWAADEHLGSKGLFVSLDLLSHGSNFLMEWKEGKLAANLNSELESQAYEEALFV